MALKADNGTIVARAMTIDWPNGGGQSLVQSLNGGLIQFTPRSSIRNPNGGVPSALLADGIGSRIEAEGLITSMGNAGGTTGAKASMVAVSRSPARARSRSQVAVAAGGCRFPDLEASSPPMAWSSRRQTVAAMMSASMRITGPRGSRWWQHWYCRRGRWRAGPSSDRHRQCHRRGRHGDCCHWA